MNIPKEYVDEWRMIVTLEQDGGDSAFYCGHYHYLNKSERKEACHVATVLTPKGKVRRHPDDSKWYGDSERGSRDQSIPLLIMCFACGCYSTAILIFKAHLKRGLLFTTNTRRNGATKENHGEVYKKDKKGNPIRRNYNWKLPDVTGPNFWSIYIRGFRSWPLWFFLCVFDLFLLLGVVSFNLSPREPNQLLLLLAFSKERLPTPLSWLAWKVLDKTKVKLELWYYWMDKSHGDKVWRPSFIGDMWQEWLGKQ